LKIQNYNLDIISEYYISKKELEDLQIEGSAFLFTGELTEDREDCKDFIVGYGGLIKSTITSKVDYVVVGAEYGWSKIQKIHLLNSERNLRIRLLSNADFLRLKERYEKLNF
jgi:DNA polymerase-3 subunit epsilon|tara:strand:- start:2938 stop:3273 length:336 start_codon:yes stop_codon:yes gene_type:complete